MLVTVTFFPLADQSIFQLNSCEDTEIYKTLIPSKAVLPFGPTFDSAFGIFQSIKKKSSSVCDLVISKHLDVLAITVTWLTGKSWNSTVAEILNTLKGYEFYDVSRVSRTGGGEGVFLQRGFRLSLFPSHLWST